MSTIQATDRGRLGIATAMSATDDEVRRTVRDLAARAGTGRAALVPLVRDVKALWGHIPSSAIDEMASTLGLDYAKVHSVASFYDLLDRLDRGLPAAS